MVLIASLVLLLGLSGAVLGIHVANVNAAVAAVTAPPTGTSTPTRTSTPTPTGRPTSSATPTGTASPTMDPKATSTGPDGGITLPNLVRADFVDARDSVRDLGLNWTLVFGAAGSDRTVVATDPVAGTVVPPGATVKITVRGVAPPVAQPAIDGARCTDAVESIIDAGLVPTFVTGLRTGVAFAPPQPGLRWNDHLLLACSG